MLKGDNIPTPTQCVTDYGIDPTTVDSFKSYSVTTQVGEFDVDGNDIASGALYVCATDNDNTDATATALDNFIATRAVGAGLRWYFFDKL